MSYNVILTLDTKHTGADLADQVHNGTLDAYSVVTGVDHRGRAQLILTIEATNLVQAAATAKAVTTEAGFTNPVRLEVMTTHEYDRGDEPIPPLVSLTQAAQTLGVTRQAIQSRINHGTLPATKAGNTWVIPAAAIARETATH